MTAITNIWVSATSKRPEEPAKARARELGYADPHVARTVLVQGTHGGLIAVIVAEGKEEAEANAAARRRGSRSVRPTNGGDG